MVTLGAGRAPYLDAVNALDLLLIAVIVVAAVSGARVGFIARGFSWIGIAIGLVIANWSVPAAVRLLSGESSVIRMLAAVVTLFVTLGLTSSLGESAGFRLRRAVHRTSLKPLDRAAGGGAGALGVLVIVWLLMPALANVPGTVASQVRNSTVVGLVREQAPPPPNTMQALRGLIDQSRFPEVFSDLGPAPDTGPPPSQLPVPQEVISTVIASTVNLESEGCGSRYEGSGWAVSEDLIVTNAHVVAGADVVRARTPDGAVLEATVVAFDDDKDLALVRVPGLGQAPLPMARADIGQEVVVVGYPGGQDTPRTAPGAIRDRRPAIGRDIYGEDIANRNILVMAAELRQGDSGSPVVNAAGEVVGVTFAVAADRSSTAYALDSGEVEELLAGPRGAGSGRCV